ncbi:protein CURVATURE THYLAKOID 1D, chloroplastic-like [Nymphaea colorata]|nr:protein CURVATURE THYLAKOID 1D, chloroplastic-like [Nymphaea colorata]
MAIVAATARCSFFSHAAPPKPRLPAVNASASFSSLKSFRHGVAAANPFIRFPGLRYHASPYSNSTTSEETLPRFSGEFDKDPEPEEASVVEDSSLDKDTEAGELLDNLTSKLASEESYAIFLYGSGALVAVWVSSIIVTAVDSIPLFPQLMEVVGIAFTVWFSYRYLLFKRNRDELVAKLREIKEQVLGSSDS